MNESFFDPELDNLIDRLRPTPERDPEAVARGQARFLAEMEPLFEPTPAQPFWQRLLPGMFSQRSKEISSMATRKQKLVFSSVLALVAFLVVLLGGASATALAAQSALPGETLYPLKTGLEDTQVRLSRNAAIQAELHLTFAQRRLDEIARLIEQGRFDEIQLAASEFEAHVQEAIAALQAVSSGDPLQAKELAGKIASSLSAYANTLSGMLTSVPEPIRPAVEQALQFTQAGDDQVDDETEFSGTIEAMDGLNWIVAGIAFQVSPQTEIKGSFSLGDMVKVHASRSGDGSLVAREIEPADDDGIDDDDSDDDDDSRNSNVKDDDSDDDDDGSNSNDKDDDGDDDDDGNSNDDDDGDDDDDGNSNDDDDDDDDNSNNNDDDDDDDDDDGDDDGGDDGDDDGGEDGDDDGEDDGDDD